jgi:hypothetical protein
MPFPDLQPRTDNRKGPGGTSVIWAEADGVPDNGANTFGLPFLSEGVDPAVIDEDWIDVRVDALGPSVTGAQFVSLSPDKTQMTINFTQVGADQARVRVQLLHSLIS